MHGLKRTVWAVIVLSIIAFLVSCGTAGPAPLAAQDEPTLVYIYTEG
ncbi:MAG: hypothetical protein KDJ52_24220 [Anaerolineae bacterium]|nr:hypothetical protein [Anaerolineae bacterium]